MYHLEPTLGYLEARLHLSEAELSRLVVATPPVLGYSEDNLEQTLGYLERRLELDGGALRRLVLALPATLGYSLDKNLAPTLDFYAETLELQPRDLGGLICSLPALLGYSLTKRLEPRRERCRAAGVALDVTRVKYLATMTDAKFWPWFERRVADNIPGD